ncbi:MAG: phage holin family protein [Minisyncoccia bacterium]
MLFHWLISTVAVGIAAYVVPGVVVTIPGAFVVAVALGALNLFLRPILIVLTLPITVLTLGLFSLVINALLVMLTAYLVPGFSIAGFWSALYFALVLSVIHWVFHFWGHR